MSIKINKIYVKISKNNNIDDVIEMFIDSIREKENFYNKDFETLFYKSNDKTDITEVNETFLTDENFKYIFYNSDTKILSFEMN